MPMWGDLQELGTKWPHCFLRFKKAALPSGLELACSLGLREQKANLSSTMEMGSSIDPKEEFIFLGSTTRSASYQLRVGFQLEWELLGPRSNTHITGVGTLLRFVPRSCNARVANRFQQCSCDGTQTSVDASRGTRQGQRKFRLEECSKCQPSVNAPRSVKCTCTPRTRCAKGLALPKGVWWICNNRSSESTRPWRCPSCKTPTWFARCQGRPDRHTVTHTVSPAVLLTTHWETIDWDSPRLGELMPDPKTKNAVKLVCASNMLYFRHLLPTDHLVRLGGANANWAFRNAVSEVECQSVMGLWLLVLEPVARGHGRPHWE